MRLGKGSRTTLTLFELLFLALMIFSACSSQQGATGGDNDSDGSDAPADCRFDNECPDGTVCHQGDCIPEAQAPCQSEGSCALDDDCDAAQFCNDFCQCESMYPIDGDMEIDHPADGDREDTPNPCENGPALGVQNSLDFGYVPFGSGSLESLVITNLCEDYPLEITNIEILSSSTEFSFPTAFSSPVTLSNTTDNFNFDVLYSPSNIGLDEGEVIISSNDPQSPARVTLVTRYKGTVDIDVTPNPLDFHDVVLGDPASLRTLIIKNIRGEENDNAVLRINSIYMESQSNVVFEVGTYPNPFYIGQGQESEISVSCHPQVSGEVTDRILFESNDPDESTYAVEVACTGVEPILSVETLEEGNLLDFGLQRVEADVSVQLTVSNSGGGSLVVQPPIMIEGSSPFFSFDDSAFASGERVLGEGDSLNLPVRYNPTEAGDHSGQIRLQNNSFGSPNFIINLEGNAAGGLIVADPSQVDFGSVRVTQSADRELTLRNDGEVAVTLQTIDFSAASDALTFAATDTLENVTLDPGQSHVLHLHFAPASRGNFNNAVHFTTDDAVASEGDVPVNATGIAPVIQITERDNPNFESRLDFGEVRLNHSLERILELRNVGDDALHIGEAALILNTSEQEFSLVDVGTPELAPEGMVELSVSYAPVQFPGLDTGQLRVRGDDPETPEILISLRGMATDQRLFFSPSAPMNFGDIHFQASSVERVLLYNSGISGNLVVTGMEIVLGQDVFTLEPLSQELPFELFPNQQNSLAVDVKFVPALPEGREEADPEDFEGSLRIFANSYVSDETDYALAGRGVPCPDGFWDLDGNPEDCEYPCNLKNGGVEICNGEDDDCDGQFDEDENITSNCVPPENSDPVCVDGACDFICRDDFHRCNSLCFPDSDPQHCGEDCVFCGDDALECTDPVCEDDQCGQAVRSDRCLIDGACYTFNGKNPENDCEVCIPFFDNHGWNNRDDGEICDDRLFCTVNTTCHSGQCTSEETRDCSSAVTQSQCQVATCNEDEDRCEALPANDGGDCRDGENGDGWYDTGDVGPGCSNMSDPDAERRDYSCSTGACVYAIAETRFCNAQDDYYGGGNNEGCGEDPPSVQRDYYVSEEGVCDYSTTNCAAVDCDAQDVCRATCDGNVIREYRDYFAEDNSPDCAFVFGPAVDNCETRLSVDTDGGADDYLTGGVVTDSLACSEGSCTVDTHADYCSGTILNEYGANGAGVTGPVAYDCQNYEDLFCTESRYLFRNEWDCKGSPAYCADSGFDTQVNDCGRNECTGVCGSGPDGCTYHEKGCEAGGCFDRPHGSDEAESYCQGCGLSWNLGGEIGASTCCGDDAAEFVRNCSDSSDNGQCGTDTRACCSTAESCVDHDGNCADSGACSSFGGSVRKSFCEAGVWEDPDESADFCTGDGCGFDWLAFNIFGNRCCGDDPGEDFEQQEGADRACCYNGLLLPSGESSDSVLCQDGLLYDCNGAANDDSDIAEDVEICGRIGDLFCRDTEEWGETKSAGCECESDEECESGHCQEDVGGTGSWCTTGDQCVHEGVFYDSGTYSPVCFDNGSRARCNNGAWISESCGTDTVCTDHLCSDGACHVSHFGDDTPCNNDYLCSSGPGDGAYGVGGGFRCQGFCDGSGTCDYAANCEDCNLEDGWHNHGDDGPGCFETNDPTAELRDYFCAVGVCTHSVTETKDCDDRDGYYGGGDTEGCGNDPVSQQRDYYVSSTGLCVYGTSNCETVSCDGQDNCSSACEGDAVKSFRDFYVEENSSVCAYRYGESVEDCTLKASVDSDGSPTGYSEGGIVSDYLACSNGACVANDYADYCSGSMLNEYGALDAGITGPLEYQCQDNETLFCHDARYLYRNEWECAGSPGYCRDSGYDSVETDCGVDACQGICGSGENGCKYHLRGCQTDACSDLEYDADDSETYCTGCNRQWALGGEAAVDACCGDDAEEFVRECDDSSENGNCGADLSACCRTNTACVDHDGNCAAHGSCFEFGAEGKNSYCNAGQWEDPDEGMTLCMALGCNFSWMGYTLYTNRCCGDDPGEDIEQIQGLGRSCCYNGVELPDMDHDASILCHDGLLYDCNGAADDDSTLPTDVSVCGRVGDLYCSADDTWSETLMSGCPCQNDTDCSSGHCKQDFDGEGSWCAEEDQCVHDNVIHADGAYASDCLDDGNRALCESGAWTPFSCGTDDICTNYSCLNGACQVAYAGTATVCDTSLRCSSGEGDDAYGLGGDHLCSGRCDGSGHCDYAGACVLCSDNDGWHNTGDNGPGCASLADPIAEQRDYYCSPGLCAYNILDTLNCNGQDGYYGGGNTGGCGTDSNSQQRDYYANASGACVYTTENCESVNCDVQDVCSSVCEDDSVMAYKDYFVEPNTGSCTFQYGALLEDCTARNSTDSDGSATAYTVAGQVTDYLGCSEGACTTAVYADSCSDTVLSEYGANGASVSGPNEYDCQLYETLFCQDSRHLYRNEWDCNGNPGQCEDSGFDTPEQDCGVNSCDGVCGSGPNSCVYHLRGCSGQSCFDNAFGADEGQSYCTGCGLSWNVGGEVAANACCGDDANEFVSVCDDSSANGACGTDVSACCTASDNCVDHDGGCADSNACYLFGEDGRKSYCQNGVWQDPDESQGYCTASGCGFAWLGDTPLLNKCCGDDPEEDFLQTEGADRSCCYNAEELPSGSDSDSLLCADGLLYDCNGAATDDSNLSLHKVTCDPAGDLFCQPDNTWADTKTYGCPCTSNDECASGVCTPDGSGGNVCTNPGQCVHEGVFYDSGDFRPTCFDGDSRARCNNGAWESVSCGTDTSCTDYVCSSGVCSTTLHGPTTLCNVDFACSSGTGNNAYGVGGNSVCQGFCDGSGQCDYADNCSDCNAQDGWYNTGDAGSGCSNMDDPEAEERDYYCGSGSCTYSVSQTRDCDSSDGYYGGGDSAGCGADANSQQRDYFVGADGSCTFSTANCATVNCDAMDVCENACDGSSIKAYKDYYVDPGTANCVYAFGTDVEDCSTKLSTDSDGSPTAYQTGGTVTDYTTCLNGACTSQAYADYCAGSMLNEYGAGGAGILGPAAYNCQDFETYFCTDSRYRYRNEWDCGGSPAACSDSGFDTFDRDCGVNSCSGTCGSGPNGCLYFEQGCSGGDCYSSSHDPDQGLDYCNGCSLSWNIGGETAAESCCGDDGSEFARTCNNSSANGECGEDTTACCDAGSDCVDHTGGCAETGVCHAFGDGGKNSYCSNGQWQDPDESLTYCTASGCGYTWIANATLANKCCGDDAGEDIEQSESAGRGCCYNGSWLSSGDDDGSVLCYNGLLYDCNGAATDDSELSEHILTCGTAGGMYCTASNTWMAAKPNGCSCSNGSECDSGACKNDYDGSGSWCADNDQCAHNAAIYDSGETSADCYDNSNQALCSDGNWNTSSCGTDTSCTNYYCQNGSCGVSHYNTSTQCNSSWTCSSGTGDNRYNAGGNYLCRGYCDGSGSCDYADSCDNCTDNYSHASGSCASNSCQMGDCNSGWGDCSGGSSDGCETQLDGIGGACADATGIGSVCGDQGGGFLCGSSYCKTGPSTSGYGEKWLKIDVNDCTSICTYSIRLRARLQSPAGMDYDLYLYDGCGSLVDSSTAGTGGLDEVTYSWGSGDDKTMYLEIRWYAGSTCDEWTLETKGGCSGGW